MMASTELGELCHQLQKYLEKGWVRPSILLYRAIVLFVHKKEGSLQMWIDLHKLNKETKPDSYPIP